MRFTERENSIFGFIADYLTYSPRMITADLMRQVTMGEDSATNSAYALLLASLYGLDSSDKNDKAVIFEYFLPMVRKYDKSVYENDSFYKLLLKTPNSRQGKWAMGKERYEPYELFVAGNPKKDYAGRIIPNLGFFTEPFDFPVVYENGREWMSLKPNEIETMRAPLSRAKGKVLVGGLGIGYFATMCADKADVESVTVIEKEQDAVDLFNSNVAQLTDTSKIKIVLGDAVAYAKDHLSEFDYAFMDLWHDPTDGTFLYTELKYIARSAPKTVCDYWIEDTLKLYLPDNVNL